MEQLGILRVSNEELVNVAHIYLKAFIGQNFYKLVLIVKLSTHNLFGFEKGGGVVIICSKYFSGR